MRQVLDAPQHNLYSNTTVSMWHFVRELGLGSATLGAPTLT